MTQTFSSLTYTIENRIATITLNKPDRRNALDDVMIKELTDVLTILNRDTSSRVVLITGAGSAFCAGMDLAYLQKFSSYGETENLEDARSLQRMLQLLHTLRKPTIAVVNGPALGGGCGIAAACDFVFAAREKGKLGVPEVKLGFVPAVILIYLVKRMGAGAAREFVLRGDILNPEGARLRGLVTEVEDDADLLETATEFGVKLASSTSPSSIKFTKDLFARFDEMGPKEALDYAATLNALSRKTEDFQKGVNSFLIKEKPEW